MCDVSLDDVILEPSANESFTREYSVFRVRHGLSLGWHAYQAAPVLREGHYGWRSAHPLLIFDDARESALHHGYA